MRPTTVRNGPKRIVSVSDRLGLLQMVSKPVTGWCANEDAGPPRIVDYEIPHRLERERNILYKGVKTSP